MANNVKTYHLPFRPNKGNVVMMFNSNVATILNFEVVSMLLRCGKAITKLFIK